MASKTDKLNENKNKAKSKGTVRDRKAMIRMKDDKPYKPSKAKASPKKASPKKPASSGIHEVPTKTLQNELTRRSRTEGTKDKPKARKWTPAGKTAHKYRGGNK